jgi:antitoxin YefM
MLTTSLSEFRKDMKSYLDNVTQNFETLIINRGRDTGVVIISLEEYNSLITTQHELSSRINQQRLDKSIEALRSGKKMVKKLVDQC